MPPPMWRGPRAPLAGPTAGLHLDIVSDSLVRLAEALSGRYTIQRELGAGGMATVYLADDLKHERQVALWVVDVETEPELTLGPARILFVGSSNSTSGFGWPRYDVTPDAERFLIVRRGAPAETSVPWITLNWFEELKRRVPAGSN